MVIETSTDPESFAEFEHLGWESVSAGYEQHFSRLTGQSVARLLDAAAVGEGMQVLDLCSGPGIVSAAANTRGAASTGLDFSATAVQLARENLPQCSFLEGDAQALPFDDHVFDAVVCGFGIIHLPDPQQALSEMYRVLKPGARVAASVWQPPAPDNGFGLIYGSIKKHADMDLPLPHGPDFFQFSEPASFTQALQTIGLNETTIENAEQVWTFDDADSLAGSFMSGAVRARGLIRAQTTAVQKAIFASMAAGMERFKTVDGVYRVPMPALIGSGAR